jgi:hypothetical protein
MKILHLANWNSTNIGNGALIFGTQRLLAEDSKEPIEFIPEAWDDYTFGLKLFDWRFVNLVNSKADALMVNGAVTMNAFRRFTKNTGMRFDLPIELWDKIKKPMIFYGISYRCWPFQEYPNKAALKKTFEYMINRKDVFFGVRNDGTKEWIRRTLGLDSPRIIEVPDPGAFVPANDAKYPELHPAKKNVIIAFNNEDAVYRFATGMERKLWNLGLRLMEQPKLEKLFEKLGFYKKERTRIIRELAQAMEGIAGHHNVQFILAPHYLDDYGMIDELISVINERVAHQLTVSTGLLKVSETAFFYGRYKKADLAISMRVHSMSPSIGLGIPVIPVTSQGRMRVYLEKVGLSHIAVDVKKESFGKDIANRAVALLSDPHAFRAETAKAMEVMREQARKNNAIIFAMIKKGNPN